jgi:HD-like signal output (HDOD) protein
MDIEEIINKIESFPALDDTVSKIVDICDDPNASLLDLIKVIQQDPMTMANILKAANNPIYNFNKEIRNVAQAVSLFGMESIKSFALLTFITKMSDIDLSPYNMDTAEFYELTQKQNAFIATWYKEDKKALETLIFASHVMESGKILFSQLINESFAQCIFSENIEGISMIEELSEIEKMIFNASSEEVCALLLEKWKFSPNIYEPIRYIFDVENAPDIYKKNALILKVIKIILNKQGFDEEQNYQKAFEIVKKYNLNPKSFKIAYDLQLKVLETV